MSTHCDEHRFFPFLSFLFHLVLSSFSFSILFLLISVESTHHEKHRFLHFFPFLFSLCFGYFFFLFLHFVLLNLLQSTLLDEHKFLPVLSFYYLHFLFFSSFLTLIRVACQPLPKEGRVVFKTPTSRGKGGGARLFKTKTLDFESSVKVKF